MQAGNGGGNSTAGQRVIPRKEKRRKLMSDLQEAEPIVTEGIREQAAKLGYIVKQKGRLEKQPLSTVWHEIVSPGDPWQITSNSASGSFSRSRPFRSRTFATEAEALARLP